MQMNLKEYLNQKKLAYQQRAQQWSATLKAKRQTLKTSLTGYWPKIKKAGLVFLGTAAAVAGTFGLARGFTYISNPDKDRPAYTYVEGAAKIIVYPESGRVYEEQGRKYIKADFGKDYYCEGVLMHYPRWMAGTGSDSAYSMLECSDFNKVAEQKKPQIAKMEVYLERARAEHAPKPPVG